MDNKELVLDLSSLSKQKIKIKDGDEMRDLYLNLSDLNIITRYKEKLEDLKKLQKDALEATVSRKGYVSFDENTMVGTFVRYPERNEFLEDIQENLIVEFYNR